jgi:hypothetical protein
MRTLRRRLLKPRKPQKNLPTKSLGEIMLNLLRKKPQKFLKEKVGLKIHQSFKQVHLAIDLLPITQKYRP